MRGGGGYWGKTGHGNQQQWRQFVIHNVTSPPQISALRRGYSITSSAIESTPDGMVRPSALTVFRLMTS